MNNVSRVLITLIAILNISGCSVNSTCSQIQHDGRFRYNDQVIVTRGWHKGIKGLVKKQEWIYDGSNCRSPAFEVQFIDILTLERIMVKQSDLEKANSNE